MGKGQRSPGYLTSLGAKVSAAGSHTTRIPSPLPNGCTMMAMIDEVRYRTWCRLVCEATAVAASLPLIAPGTHPGPSAVHVNAVETGSPFPTEDLPEDDTPVRHRIYAGAPVYDTSGTYGSVERWLLLPPHRDF